MNLKTAALLCNRFMTTVVDTGLIDQLGDLVTEVEKHQRTPSSTDVLSKSAKEMLKSCEGSVFADPSLQLFPEYKQLGFSDLMGSSMRGLLEKLASGTIDGGQLEHIVMKLNADHASLTELSEEVQKLLSVAQFFGVKQREPLTSKAIAVIQMPEEMEEGQHSLEHVNKFIDRIQSFQSIIQYCENDEEKEGTTNIRMISGDEPLVVADLSPVGATVLQNIISEARTVQYTTKEIGTICDRLTTFGVSEDLIKMLKDEAHHIGHFEGKKSASFFKSFSDTETNLKNIAQTVLTLIEDGVRIDAVVLDETNEDVLTPEETEVTATAERFPSDVEANGEAESKKEEPETQEISKQESRHAKTPSPNDDRTQNQEDKEQTKAEELKTGTSGEKESSDIDTKPDEAKTRTRTLWDTITGR